MFSNVTTDFELINHVNNFTALIVNFTNIVVGKLCENT